MRSKLNLDFSSLLFLDKKQTKIKAKQTTARLCPNDDFSNKVGFYEADAINWQYCK